MRIGVGKLELTLEFICKSLDIWIKMAINL